MSCAIVSPSGQCVQQSQGPIKEEILLPIYQPRYSTKSVGTFKYTYVYIHTHAHLHDPKSAVTNNTNAFPSFNFKSRTYLQA